MSLHPINFSADVLLGAEKSHTQSNRNNKSVMYNHYKSLSWQFKATENDIFCQCLLWVLKIVLAKRDHRPLENDYLSLYTRYCNTFSIDT